MKPLFSIIMPLYNCDKFIDRSIGSVLSQTLTSWQLIIIDDCSTDKSAFIADGYLPQDERIHLVRLRTNRGAAEARNTGIRLAEGRYITFLDGDDYWLPHKLESQADFISENKASFVFSAYERVSEDGHGLGVVGVPSKVCYKDILKSCVIGCLTSTYDTDALGKLYMPNIRKRQDLGLWLKILKRIDFAYGQNEILAEYTVRSDSISSNKLSAAKFQWRLYREIEKLSLPTTLFNFTHYAVRGILKSHFPLLANNLKISPAIPDSNAQATSKEGKPEHTGLF